MLLFKATNGIMWAAADMYLLSVVGRILLTKKGCNHIVAFYWMLLVSHVSLNVVWNPMIEMGSLGLKKCAFICGLNFFTILNM